MTHPLRPLSGRSPGQHLSHLRTKSYTTTKVNVYSHSPDIAVVVLNYEINAINTIIIITIINIIIIIFIKL